MVGKYSTPVTFAGARPAQEVRQAAKVDWAARIDAKVKDDPLYIVKVIKELLNVDLTQSESTTQYSGKCPYPRCSSTKDSFMVWPGRSTRKGSSRHYYCRKCGNGGDIIALLEDIKGWTFGEVLGKLGLKDVSAAPVERQSTGQEDTREKALQAYRAGVLLKLRAMYPMLIAELAGELPAAYLASRGITVGQAQRYGLAYLPRSEHIAKDDPLRSWYGRILFPRTSPDASEGLTFSGRTLALWRPGMTPEQHKAAIDAYNATLPDKDPRRIRRHMTTGRGFFGYEDAARARRIVLCEGEFDALSLMLSGVEGVIAVGTTRFDRALIPFSAETVVLALDTDDAGKEATYHLTGDLQAFGLDVETVLPIGKDWNDTYAECGADLIRALFAAPVEADLSTLEDKQAGAVDIPATIVHTKPEDAGEIRTETGQPAPDCAEDAPDYDAAEAALRAPALSALCATCLMLEHDIDASAEYAGFGYCSSHLPGQRPLTTLEEIEELFARLLWFARYSPADEARYQYALDLETTGLDPRLHKVVSIALGTPGHVDIIDCRQYYGLPVEQQERWRAALCTLFTLSVTWIGFNLKFDASMLLHHFGVKLNRVYDCMLAEQLIYAGRPAPKGTFSLLQTAGRYDLEVTKEEREWFPALDTRPAEWRAPFPEQIISYIKQDIEIPYLLYERQQEPIVRDDLARVVDLENGALPAVASMEVAGVRVDVQRWRAVLSEKQARQDALAQQLQEVLGNALTSAQPVQQQAMFEGAAPVAKLNLASSDQKRAALAALGVSVSRLSGEELEMHKGEHTAVGLLLEWQELQKFTSSFGESVLKYVRGDGRIHASFGQIGAVSGRIISRDPNIQQTPRQDDDKGDDDIRACFVAAPGCKLVIADWSNIELRILAELSGDEKMLAAFASGEDLHAATARLMFNLAPDINPKKHIINGVSARQIAKTINFGLNYGMGAALLAARIGVDLETAKRYRARYQETYARATAWLRNTGRKVQTTGVVSTPAGRRRQFLPEQAKDYGAELSAKNHPIQGTNADILKRALALLHDRLPAGVQIVLTVHDEIVLEAPEALTEQAEAVLKTCMLEACKDFLKIVHIPEPDVLISPYWKKG